MSGPRRLAGCGMPGTPSRRCYARNRSRKRNGPRENGARKEKQVRALRIQPTNESPQDDVPDTLHRWTAAKRTVILEEKIDAVLAELARIASALERRVS